MKKAVVIFSGGIDSVSACVYLKPKYDLYGISFLYGQKACLLYTSDAADE